MNRIAVVAVLAALIALCDRLSAEEKLKPRFEGKPLTYWVERLQNSGTDHDRRLAADAIVAFGSDASPAISALVDMLDDRSAGFREQVGWILKKLGPVAKTAAPALIKSLKEKTARSPKVVIVVLGAIGAEAKEAVPVILPALDDEDLALVNAAVEALCQIGRDSEEVPPAVAKAIRRAKVFRWIQLLPDLGEKAVPILVELLDDPLPAYRQICAEALDKIGPPAKEALMPLKKKLRDEDVNVRVSAAVALWRIDRDVDGVGVLSSALEDQYHHEAVSTLAEIGPAAKSAIPGLKACRKRLEKDRDFAKLEDVDQAIKKIESVEKP